MRRKRKKDECQKTLDKWIGGVKNEKKGKETKKV